MENGYYWVKQLYFEELEELNEDIDRNPPFISKLENGVWYNEEGSESYKTAYYAILSGPIIFDTKLYWSYHDLA